MSDLTMMYPRLRSVIQLVSKIFVAITKYFIYREWKFYPAISRNEGIVTQKR